MNELKQGRAGEDKGGAGALGTNAANLAGELAARGRASVKELKQGEAGDDRDGAVGSGAANAAGDVSSTAPADGIEAGASFPRFLGLLGVLSSVVLSFSVLGA